MKTRRPLTHIPAFLTGLVLVLSAIVTTPTQANAASLFYECGEGTTIPACPSKVRIVNDRTDEVFFECGEGTAAPVCPPKITLFEDAPPPEVCDGQDNNDNGYSDEGQVCPDGYTCHGAHGCLPTIPASTLTDDDTKTLAHWKQFRLGFNTALAATGGKGEVDGQQFSPQVGVLGQFRPGASWFGIELGINVGRSYREDYNGGDTTDLSENLLTLWNINPNWIITAGYKGEHGADLDFQATRVHLGELGIRYGFGNGDHWFLGAAGLLGRGVQAIEVEDTMIGQPTGESEIIHRDGLRYGALVQLVWLP